MRTRAPLTPPHPSLPDQPQRAPKRAKFTDPLLYTWERLRPAQRDAARQMVEHMQATMASERRTRRIITLLVLVALVGAAVLVYVVMLVPGPTH